MKKLALVSALPFSLALAACGGADAPAVEEAGDQMDEQAEAMEMEAEQLEDAGMDMQAEAVEEDAEALEDQADEM